VSWLVEDALWRWDWIRISWYPLCCLVRSLLTQQSIAAVTVPPLKLNNSKTKGAWKCRMCLGRETCLTIPDPSRQHSQLTGSQQ